MSLIERLTRLHSDGHARAAEGLLDDARFSADRTTPAAVLAAITDRERPGFVLIHRPSTMRAHPGQVAFPGGKLDPGEGPVEAALREAHEELGTDPGQVRVIGTSDLFHTGTGYAVTPVLAVVPPDLELLPNPTEVAAWFEAPVDHVFDPANQIEQVATWQGAERRYIEIMWQQHRIWGVTRGDHPQSFTQDCLVTVLPASDWTARDDLAGLVRALGKGKARYVGGAVRDTLLGLAVKDIDIATPREPAEVIRLLKTKHIQVIPTGIEHGTVTAVLPGGPVEITTLRHDVTTDGRRATVAYASDWQDDAARRDFTINALYADPASGEVFDWFGGLEDLAGRRVRFIGDARQRIREDHLRILRYFRFQARFGSEPADAESESACAELAATLKGLSRERVGMEMLNLLGLDNPAPTVGRMAELGVLAVVLPEAEVEALAGLVAEERRQDVAPDALRRLAALLPADVSLAEQVASRFRLSGAQKKRLALAAGRILPGTGRGTAAEGGGGGAQASFPDLRSRDHSPVPLHHASHGPPPCAGEDPRALAYRLGREAALDRLLIAGADIAPLTDWQIPAFPLKGGEIVARGVKAGPSVARTLQAVEARWVAVGFDDEQIPALLDAELAAQP